MSIDSILGNRDALIQSIEQNLETPPLTATHDGNSSTQELNRGQLMMKEEQLSSQLHDLNNLKILSGLLIEFKTNFELLELENCFYSLQSIRKRINGNNNSSFLKQSFHFQRSVAVYVDTMHSTLIDKIFEIITTKFWQINDTGSIAFHKKITYGPEDIDLEYESFIDFVKQQYFPQNVLDSQLWIISDMDINDLQENVRGKLQTILKSYIHLNVVIDRIKKSIFTKGKMFDYELGKLLFKDVSNITDNQSLLQETIASFTSLVRFFQDILIEDDCITVLTSLGNVISNELTKLVKQNASVILNDNSPLKDRIIEVSKSLVKLADRTKNQWHFNDSEILNILNNEQIYFNLMLDKKFNEALEYMRDTIKNDGSISEVETVFLKRDSKRKSESDSNANESAKKIESQNSSKKEPDDDNWNWDDNADDGEGDDAWGDEIDLDLDDLEQNENQSQKEKDKTNEDHAEDDWDNAWGLDDDITDTVPTTNASHQGTNIEINKLPQLFETAVERLNKSVSIMDQAKIDQQYYNYKFNVFQSSFVAMCSCHFQENWWIFYNNLRYIGQKNPSLQRIEELSQNYLRKEIALNEKRVFKLIQQQLNSLLENENNVSWHIVTRQLIPFIQQHIIDPLVKIGGKEGEDNLLQLLNFIYFTSTVDVILTWKVISEKNSENLSELFTLLLNDSTIPLLSNLPKYKELREKFSIIGKILPLHLKEIMDLFYDGDFYLFSTEEIAQWLKLLFADTPLRRNAIEDIYEIRNTNIAD